MGITILIVGYYGYGNSGDDAILSSICKDIRRIDEQATIQVLSYKPEKTSKDYDVKAYNRFGVLSVLKAIKGSDVVLLGGGTLLQDLTSTKSIYYYLAILKLAKLFKKKVMLFANGIGPISKKSNRFLTKHIVNKVDLVTLRESLSLKLLDKMDIVKPTIEVTADPVFSLDLESVDIMDKRTTYNVGENYVTVMARSWKNTEAYVSKLANLCDYIYETYNKQIVFVPMKYPQDIQVTKAIMTGMVQPSVMIDAFMDASQISEVIKGSTVVLSMRLHALIYAAMKNVPMIGFEYDPKVAYYLKEMEMPLAGDIMNLDVEKTKKIIDDVLTNYNDYKNTLEIRTDHMKVEASKNRKLLKELIDR